MEKKDMDYFLEQKYTTSCTHNSRHYLFWRITIDIIVLWNEKKDMYCFWKKNK